MGSRTTPRAAPTTQGGSTRRSDADSFHLSRTGEIGRKDLFPAPNGIRNSGPSPYRAWVVAVGLAGLSLLAYANSFSAGFTLDNNVVLLRDPRLRAWSADNLGLVFTQDYWWPNWPSNLYRPLTTLSYLVNWAVLGHADRPAGYHVVNLLLHWLNACLVFLIARRLFAGGASPSLSPSPSLSAAFAAALFAVHPVATEGVTNIVGRADELAALAVFAGFLCHLRAQAAATPDRRRLWRSAVGLIALAGVFAKEGAIMLVALLPLHAWVFGGFPPAGSWRERLRGAAASSRRAGADCLPVLPAAIALFAVRYVMFRHTPLYGEIFVDNPIAQAAPLQGFLTAMKVLGRYLGLLVWPATLSADYSYSQIPLHGEADSLWEDLQCWLGLAAVGALAALALRRRRTQPVFCFGVLFFFGMLLPTANLLFPIGSIMGERFLYLPLAGFCLAAAPGLLAAGRALAAAGGGEENPSAVSRSSLARFRSLALPLLVLAALTLRTFARNADWQDNYTLWRSAASACPDSYKVHMGLADELYLRDPTEAGCDAAIAEATLGFRVLDARPLDPQRRNNVMMLALGQHYVRKGAFCTARGAEAEANAAYHQAVEVLSRAQEIDQWNNTTSRRSRLARRMLLETIPDVGNYRLYVLMAKAYIGLKEWPAALAAADYAVRLNPLQAEPFLTLGYAQMGGGNDDAAAVAFIQTLILQGDSAPAWEMLERISIRQELRPSAIARNPAGRMIDASHPRTREWLNRAFRILLRRMRSAQATEAYATIRERALKSYGCSPASIDPSP